MTVGLTIPGVETVHPREVWEPNGVDNWYGDWLLNAYGDLRRSSAFHRQPPGLTIGNVEYIATHYTSAINLPDGDPGEILDGIDGIRALLARSHYDYLVNRTGGGYTRNSDGRHFDGYPLGYSFAIDWLGGVWEINGWNYRPAATASWNGKSLAWLMLTDREDPGSDLMWQSHRALSREAERRGANITPARVWSHGWFAERTGKGTATGCCGDALEAQIEAGMGDWTQEPSEEDTMEVKTPDRIVDTRESGTRLQANSTQTYVVPGGAGYKAAQITFTIVNPSNYGYLQTWPGGPRPTGDQETSFHNYVPGQDPTAQTLFVALDANGAFKMFTLGRTHLIVDFTGLISK